MDSDKFLILVMSFFFFKGLSNELISYKKKKSENEKFVVSSNS